MGRFADRDRLTLFIYPPTMSFSPTDLRTPIETTDRLIGRESQLQMLAKALATPQGGLHVVLGGAGCGKTSLLRALRSLLLQRLSGASLPGEPWAALGPILPVWVTLGNATSPAELLRNIVWAFRSTAREQLGVCQVDEDQLKLQLDAYVGNGDLKYLDRGFREVYQVVEAGRRGLRLALLIDDIESIQAQPWRPSLLSSLHELLLPYTPNNRSQELTLICSGGPQFQDFLESPDSPWKNTGWNPIPLAAWADEQIAQTVRQSATLAGLSADWVDAELVSKLADASGGHPYLLSAELLPGLLAAGQMGLAGAALQQALTEQVKGLGEADFWARWLAQLSEQARIVFRALLPQPADPATPTAGRPTVQALGLTRDQVVLADPSLAKNPLATSRALKHLLYSGLVRERGDRFSPGPALWTQWFQSHAPLPLSGLLDGYKSGLAALLAQLGPGHARYQDALVFQQRLTENIERSQRHGDNENWRSERSLIIEGLNSLAQETVGRSFNALTGLASG